MEKEKFILAEYEELRKELLSRVKILYQILNLAIVIFALFIVLLIWLYFQSIASNILVILLLFVPIVFAFITFIYQDNQKTLEGVAKYLHDELLPDAKKIADENIWQWEDYFVKRKKSYQVSSAFKIFVLILPLLIPFYLIWQNLITLPAQWPLAIFDIVLSIIVLINFRYKLNRIK